MKILIYKVKKILMPKIVCCAIWDPIKTSMRIDSFLNRQPLADNPLGIEMDEISACEVTYADRRKRMQGLLHCCKFT